MYLVRIRRWGSAFLIFTWEDPRSDGYRGPVTEDTALDFSPEAVHWPRGGHAPDTCVGHAPNEPTSLKVFQYRSQLRRSGYVPVEGSPEVFGRWADFRDLCGA